MAPLLPFENMSSGGDSRSNPLNFPRNRALRCLNWVPKQAGFWEQRWGYSSVTMSLVSFSAIHSMFPYRTWDGHKYVLFMSADKTLKTLDTSTGTVTTPTVLGTAVASTSKGAGYFAANRFHYGNGTDQKWFDGTSWRDNGIPAPMASQFINVDLSVGVREVSHRSLHHYLNARGDRHLFTGKHWPLYLSRVFRSPHRRQLSERSRPSHYIGGLRASNYSRQPENHRGQYAYFHHLWLWVGKLVARHGGQWRYSLFFFTNTSTNLNSCTRVGQSVTASATAHGLTTGDVVIVAGTTNYDGTYAVTVIGANSFSFAVSILNTSGPTGAVGTVKRIVQTAMANASVDVLDPVQDTSYQVNQHRGMQASTVGGPTPGYRVLRLAIQPQWWRTRRRTAWPWVGA